MHQIAVLPETDYIKYWFLILAIPSNTQGFCLALPSEIPPSGTWGWQRMPRNEAGLTTWKVTTALSLMLVKFLSANTIPLFLLQEDKWNVLVVLNSHMYLNCPVTYQLIVPWALFFFWLLDKDLDRKLPDSSPGSLSPREKIEALEMLRSLLLRSYITKMVRTGKRSNPGLPHAL